MLSPLSYRVSTSSTFEYTAWRDWFKFELPRENSGGAAVPSEQEQSLRAGSGGGFEVALALEMAEHAVDALLGS